MALMHSGRQVLILKAKLTIYNSADVFMELILFCLSDFILT